MAAGTCGRPCLGACGLPGAYVHRGSLQPRRPAPTLCLKPGCAAARYRSAFLTVPSLMPPSAPSPVTIALITAVAAFFAAVLAHAFSVRRDERTYARGVYEKLYEPVIFDALLYLDAHSLYRSVERRRVRPSACSSSPTARLRSTFPARRHD